MQLHKRSSFISREQDEWNEKAKTEKGLQPDYPTKHCDPKDGRQLYVFGESTTETINSTAFNQPMEYSAK